MAVWLGQFESNQFIYEVKPIPNRCLILVGIAAVLLITSAPYAQAQKGKSRPVPLSEQQLNTQQDLQAENERRSKTLEASLNWHQRTHAADQWDSTSRGSIYPEPKYGAERLDWRVVSPRYIDKIGVGSPRTLYLAFDGKVELSGMLLANTIYARNIDDAKKDLDPIGIVYLTAPGTGKTASFDIGPITIIELPMSNGAMRKYFFRPLSMKADKVAMLAALPEETNIELWWGSSRKPEPARDFHPFTKHLESQRPAILTSGYLKYMLDVIKAGKWAVDQPLQILLSRRP